MMPVQFSSFRVQKSYLWKRAQRSFFWAHLENSGCLELGLESGIAFSHDHPGRRCSGVTGPHQQRKGPSLVCKCPHPPVLSSYLLSCYMFFSEIPFRFLEF